MRPRPQPAPVLQFQDVWATDLRQAGPDAAWLWQGYLASGRVTLLTSPAKSGKTTLLSILLKCLETGNELAGLPVQSGLALIVTEELPGQWWLRDEKLHFGNNICWQHRPFGGRKPQPDEWDALIDHILDHREQHGTALAVIDPIAHFLPAKSESESNCVLNALLPLQRLTDAGLAVLLLHHPRKESASPGNWARGSTALLGFADIVIEMHCYTPNDPDDRRRILVAGSRFDATPPRRVIELNPTGTGYLNLGNLEEAECHTGWQKVWPILATATHKLTRREILAAWPRGLKRPGRVTLWRWLHYGVTQGHAHQDGQGTSNAPYRFWLPESQQRWEQQPTPEFQKQQQADAWQDQMRGWTGPKEYENDKSH